MPDKTSPVPPTLAAPNSTRKHATRVEQGQGHKARKGCLATEERCVDGVASREPRERESAGAHREDSNDRANHSQDHGQQQRHISAQEQASPYRVLLDQNGLVRHLVHRLRADELRPLPLHL